jgi:hypothetical protein
MAIAGKMYFMRALTSGRPSLRPSMLSCRSSGSPSAFGSELLAAPSAEGKVPFTAF